MDERLVEQYAVLVYVLIAISFIVTPWAAWLFLKWRKFVVSKFKKAIFTYVPVAMIGLFICRLLAVFQIVPHIEFQLVLAYASTVNGCLMVLMLHLATKAVEHGISHHADELREMEFNENVMQILAEGKTTPEILSLAHNRAEYIHHLMMDGLAEEFLHKPRAL